MFMFPWIDQGFNHNYIYIVLLKRKNENFQNQCLYIKTKTLYALNIF